MDQCDSLITRLITMLWNWYSGDIHIERQAIWRHKKSHEYFQEPFSQKKIYQLQTKQIFNLQSLKLVYTSLVYLCFYVYLCLFISSRYAVKECLLKCQPQELFVLFLDLTGQFYKADIDFCLIFDKIEIRSRLSDTQKSSSVSI